MGCFTLHVGTFVVLMKILKLPMPSPCCRAGGSYLELVTPFEVEGFVSCIFCVYCAFGERRKRLAELENFKCARVEGVGGARV